MFLTRWLENLGRTKTRRPAATNSAIRPRLECLDDRLAPHAGGFLFFGGPPPFAPPWSLLGSDLPTPDDDATATQFAVLTRREAFAGAETRVTVIALDADGLPVRDYAGTVTLTSSDPDATLPESYTFTDADNGRHTFTVTFATTGDQTVTATGDDGLTESATVNVEAAPVATELFVQTERDVYSGAVTRVLVAALDESNRVVRGYTGTVTLTSSDPGATLPEGYTFTASDRGVHVFEVTPSAVGDLTLTATDGAGVTGSVTVDVDAAPVVSRLAVIARPQAVTGGSVQFFVVALDADDRVTTTYTGTVAFTSSDADATLPENYTFTAADHGVKRLSATFVKTGEQTLTVTDTADAALTGSAEVNVAAAGRSFGFGFGFFIGHRPHGRG